MTSQTGETYLNGKRTGTATSSTTAFSSRHNVHSEDLWWVNFKESSDVLGQVGSKEFILCQWSWWRNTETELKYKNVEFNWVFRKKCSLLVDFTICLPYFKNSIEFLLYTPWNSIESLLYTLWNFHRYSQNANRLDSFIWKNLKTDTWAILFI